MISIEYLRQFRVGGFAMFDFVAAFIGMALLSPLLSGLCKKVSVIIPKKAWVIWMLPISVIAHVAIGKMTPLTKDVLDPSGHYLAKLVILACLVLGARGVRRVKSSL